jgi:hypothetical protein
VTPFRLPPEERALGEPGTADWYWAPILGEHTEQVLSGLLGLSSAKIERLREAEVPY